MRQIAKIDWSYPGDQRYTGPVSKAIDSYADIPEATRKKLIARASAKPPQYDEIVEIDRAGIRGKEHGYTNLREMFFGINTRAATITREAWPFDQIERALVYTEDGYTILIPTICGNVSRVDRVPLAEIPPVVDPGLKMPERQRELQKFVYAVPEPSSLALTAIALGLAFIIKRRAVRAKRGQTAPHNLGET